MVRTIQRVVNSVRAIVQHDFEAPGQRQDELVTRSVRVTSPHRAARDIVDPEGPFYLERHVPARFDEGQVSSRVVNLG